jgi:acetyltransferase-like isoleucine patch superfamily enzyme
MAPRIHPSAVVDERATLGDGTQVWLWCQIRPGVKIGRNCIFGKGVYVDSDVTIGDNVKVQNHVSIFHGVTIEDGVFVGPHVCFTNDLQPRAVNPDGSPKAATDWVVTPTLVKAGAALGANSTIVCGREIGRWAMVAAGSVVTRDVPDHALVRGNPARVVGWVCACGRKVAFEGDRAPCACGRALVRDGAHVRLED